MEVIEIGSAAFLLYLSVGYLYSVTFNCSRVKFIISLWPYYAIKRFCDKLNEKNGGEGNS